MTTPVKQPDVAFAGATARTTAAGSAQLTITIGVDLAGTMVTADENGTVSFRERRAHLYKIVPGSNLPREVVILGPIEYTNANVQAAIDDPTVPPWTRLDTRRLSKAEAAGQADEVGHVIAPAYLADGVAHPVRGATTGGLTLFTGHVDPALLERKLPATIRASIMKTVRSDYTTTPFPASFSLDSQGRIRRVHVEYTTAQGSRIVVDTTYAKFGTAVPLGLPAKDQIKDITPK